jgi:CP family cyanate transporter-like MFS transporter
LSARPAFLGSALALFLAALALRPQLVGAAPLIPAIQADLGVSHAVAGLLGTIPVLCMGVFAPLAPVLAGRLGTARAVGLAIAAISLFGLLRSVAGGDVDLLVLTIGVGIGMGVAGALLPVVVKERLARRPLAATIAYSAGLQLGAASSAALAIPLASTLGGWRPSLAAFSAVTLVVLLPWTRLAARGGVPAPRLAISRRTFLDHGRAALGLAATFALFGVVYYGLVAWLPDAFVERGWTPGAAGGLVGLLNVASLAGALTVGTFAGRVASDAATSIGLAIGFAVAAVGFAAVPAAAPAWAVLAGFANGALVPLILALPVRLADAPASVAALSSLMLGAGYTVASLSPLGLGAVRDAAGDFGPSLVLVAVAAVAFAASLAVVVRRHAPPEAATAASSAA